MEKKKLFFPIVFFIIHHVIYGLHAITTCWLQAPTFKNTYRDFNENLDSIDKLYYFKSISSWFSKVFLVDGLGCFFNKFSSNKIDIEEGETLPQGNNILNYEKRSYKSILMGVISSVMLFLLFNAAWISKIKGFRWLVRMFGPFYKGLNTINLTIILVAILSLFTHVYDAIKYAWLVVKNDDMSFLNIPNAFLETFKKENCFPTRFPSPEEISKSKDRPCLSVFRYFAYDHNATYNILSFSTVSLIIYSACEIVNKMTMRMKDHVTSSESKRFKKLKITMVLLLLTLFTMFFTTIYIAILWLLKRLGTFLIYKLSKSDDDNYGKDLFKDIMRYLLHKDVRNLQPLLPFKQDFVKTLGTFIWILGDSFLIGFLSMLIFFIIHEHQNDIDNNKKTEDSNSESDRFIRYINFMAFCVCVVLACIGIMYLKEGKVFHFEMYMIAIFLSALCLLLSILLRIGDTKAKDEDEDEDEDQDAVEDEDAVQDEGDS